MVVRTRSQSWLSSSLRLCVALVIATILPALGVSPAHGAKNCDGYLGGFGATEGCSSDPAGACARTAAFYGESVSRVPRQVVPKSADGPCVNAGHECFTIMKNGAETSRGAADLICLDGVSKLCGESCIGLSETCACGKPLDDCPRGNPVYPANGVKFEQATDFTTGGAKPLQILRTYRSSTGSYGSTQTNWRFWFDRFFGLVSASQINIGFADGSMVQMVQQANGSFKASSVTPDLDYTMIALASPAGAYELTKSDDTVEHYETSGTTIRLVWVKTRDGYQQTLSYDASGNIATITDNLGRTLILTWATNSSGVAPYLSRIVAPDGTQIDYGYTFFTVPASGGGTVAVLGTQRLTSVTVSKPGVSGATATTTCFYENANTSLLTGITDARGVRYATFTYDSSSRVTQSVHDSGADSFTFAYTDTSSVHDRTITNPLGKLEIQHYGLVAGRQRLTGTDGQASTNCPASASAMAYNTAGYVSQTTDEEGRITKYVRDAHGLPTGITEGFGLPAQRITTLTNR